MKPMGRIVGLATQLGMTMGLTAAGCVVAGLWLGRWLDRTLQTGHLATIVCVIAGTAAGQIGLYRMATRARISLATGDEARLYSEDTVAGAGLALRALATLMLPGLLGLALGTWIGRASGLGTAIAIVLVCAGLVLGLFATVRMVRRAARLARPTGLAGEPHSDHGNEDACSDTES